MPEILKGSHGLMFLSGLLLGLGVMLIGLTAFGPQELKCTWPEAEQSSSSSINV